MNVRNLAPLGLTIAIAASLAACGKNETAPAASTDAKPAFDLSQVKTPLISLDSADLDPAISACTDLNGFVNSKWLKANPVPGDQTTWGSFEILRERSLEVQHALVQQAAASQAKAGSVEAKIGDIWKTGNDEAKIEAAGLAPLQPQLDKIAALDDTAAITRYLRDSQAEGKGVLFSLSANADYKDSANVIAYVGQGGLGLPEKGYYFDDAQARIRDAYVAYIAQVLALSGVDAAQAAEQAKAVMAFETRLAKASLSRIELRDPAKRYNPLSAADADRLTPNFSWTALFDTLKVPAAQKFSLAQPGFFGEMDKMLADVPASTWQAYLRFHTIDDAAPYLSSQFEKANFDFYGKTLRGQLIHSLLHQRGLHQVGHKRRVPRRLVQLALLKSATGLKHRLPASFTRSDVGGTVRRIQRNLRTDRGIHPGRIEPAERRQHRLPRVHGRVALLTPEVAVRLIAVKLLGVVAALTAKLERVRKLVKQIEKNSPDAWARMKAEQILREVGHG